VRWPWATRAEVLKLQADIEALRVSISLICKGVNILNDRVAEVAAQGSWIQVKGGTA